MRCVNSSSIPIVIPKHGHRSATQQKDVKQQKQRHQKAASDTRGSGTRRVTAKAGSARRKPAGTGVPQEWAGRNKARPALKSKPADKAKPAVKPKAPDARPSLKSVVIEALADMKALEVKVLDVRGLTDNADFMVIASGTSDRHVRSVAQRVVEKTKEAGFRPHGVEGQQDSDWVLIDLSEMIVHVMLPARAGVLRTREIMGHGGHQARRARLNARARSR